MRKLMGECYYVKLRSPEGVTIDEKWADTLAELDEFVARCTDDAYKGCVIEEGFISQRVL